MATNLPAGVLALNILFLFLEDGIANTRFVFKADEFQNVAFPAFERKFLTFAADALQNDTIADLFVKNIHRGSGRRGPGGATMQGQVPSEMSRQSLGEMLNRLKVKVDKKYSDAVKALLRLKEEFERNMSSSFSPGLRQLQPCCFKRTGVPPSSIPSYRYEARYRDLVNVSQECVGKSADFARTPFTLRANDAFRLMKTNYQQDTSLLWQYVATLDGHYVQFPTKDRFCDDRGNSISPLTERWMVDKLLQQKLNLVVLLDAGEKMNSPVPGKFPPIAHLKMATHAVKRLVKELAFVDRVSVVIMNGSAVTPPGCGDRLLVATDRNADLITTFVDSVQAAAQPDPGLAEGVQKAYSLLRAEKSSQGRKDTNDVIMLLTNGEYVVLHEDDILNNTKAGQDSLGGTVTHLVYLIRSGSFTPALDTLVKLADLNNLKLDNATSWPGINGAVGPTGQLRALPDTVGFKYSETVAEFYQFFPRGTAVGMDRISAVSPRRDPNTGLILTYAIPVYNSTNRGLSSLYGAAAIDVSMTALFDDVIHFKWRRNSYSFIVERERGLVLVHPKLDIPSHQTHTDPVFSTMEFVEPTLTAEQRGRILAANTSVSSFEAEIVPGRATYKTGLDLSDAQTSPVTVLYSRLPDTEYILVLVIFSDEKSVDPSTSLEERNTLGFNGEALYHHQLMANQTANNGLCAYSGDIRVKDKVTVKFSPDVFTDPEVYIHSKEPPEEIANMTQFLNQDASPPLTIRPDVLTSVVGDLRVISSRRLSRLWQDTTANGVVERFIGTPNGVFAAYPGISLPNAFDGREYGWYRESLARPGRVWVSLRRSFTTLDRRVALSTTLGDQQSVFGVTGVTVSRRSFAGLFYNTVGQCLGTNYTCHLLSDNGYLLDMLDAKLPPGSQRHLTAEYPWLANELIRRQVMNPVWCTTLSKGRHSLTYKVQQVNGVSHEQHVQDTCRLFLLHRVAGSNLLVLVMANRQREGCSENRFPPESCSNCQRRPGGTSCSYCLPTPTVPGLTSLCQCPCHCAVDFNVCQDSFRHMVNATFPLTPCYEEPEMPSLTAPGGGDRPSPAIPPCDQLCPSFEKKEDCEAVSRCRWNEDELYPVCEALVTTSTTTPATTTTGTVTVLPTNPRPTFHQKQTTEQRESGQQGNDADGSKLGGGAIAGIVVGVVAVLAVGFLIGYYKLVKPRLFSRLMETESATEIEGTNNCAHYSCRNDSLSFNVPPVTPSDVSPAPVATGVESSHNS